MNGTMPRHHAARVEAAIASGQAARSALVASWRRSSRLHHLDPGGHAAPMRLTEAELQQARERIAPLLAAAQGAMDRLYQAVGAAGCCVLLADREGVPVDRRGTVADDATFQSWGLWTGALWSEEHEGTNGIGTCLVEQRPLTIDRDQHFFARNTLLSCTAVPIYDHEAALAGVLDVSSCRADRTDAFASLIALAAGEAARRIEADLFRKVFAHARIVLTQAADGSCGGLVAVDADDLVIGATRSARLALGIAPGGALRPVPAADLLGGDAARDHLAGGQRAVLQRALLRAGGNVSAAAKALGVSRATLHRKLKRFELNH
ncbi:sigma-54-dependent Fis family transcriptional regulator [Bradyrhizobium sp. IC3069]|uniref:GAF domain-containing protein n=1 Tax=Bradyrhizobium yuanmingense TaxID=108015 RepID=A0A1C3W7Q6_9BRAD|nr:MULTISPECIES: GAF domain-containing protein [Bradyrhizobium]MCA1384674.1 sigma-54-dependent Fis family transcriptional regulator [Bradyrhizobium sp. BRP05]MCA1362002.1 sigma-54-dependent Fis family transcriptional regulator [Bradyrhizobium sp. IC4059]MCA1388361.1 sigma-54-dependent Fis family transcriptional regulator [Bradyrhizobium sp. IC3123]MCA1421404.1 sigma-54-dependent Fis family transcriptional regulator [Bradyrhizobium sp. BRP23]MCA1469935.1 sigma-54-dependent Fis family transcript